jgi:hypothetical protein
MDPITVTVQQGDGTKKEYQLVILKVVSADALGRPSTVIVGYDDTTFNLEGGEQFFTAFVPVSMAETEKPQG